MTLPLFATDDPPRIEPLAPDACVLRGFARERAPVLLADLEIVTAQAPFRHLITPGGYRMSVAMTNCGSLGWVSDERGYRYDAIDPDSGLPWPAMPASFRMLAQQAAARAGFDAFAPDACLINRYEPGSKLSLHQDKDERDKSAPIVSVSLGVPAVFLFGGTRRAQTIARVPLESGDVVVWGGASRLNYHGVAPVRPGHHQSLDNVRINLTFRRAG